MSVNCNSYEKNLMSRLQRDMSKRQAEQALRDIRYELYGDSYEQIRKNTTISGDCSESRYPDINKLMKAYYNGDYSDIY